MAGHKHHANYFLVFMALCVCTALSVIFDVIEIESRLLLIVLVLSIATAKALFVMTYFMHLKFEGRWKFVLLAPTIILAIGLPLALLPDIGVHYYISEAPQDGVYTRTAAESFEPEKDKPPVEPLNEH